MTRALQHHLLALVNEDAVRWAVDAAAGEVVVIVVSSFAVGRSYGCDARRRRNTGLWQGYDV